MCGLVCKGTYRSGFVRLLRAGPIFRASRIIVNQQAHVTSDQVRNALERSSR